MWINEGKTSSKMDTVRRIGYAAAVIRNYLKDLLVPTVVIGKTVRADVPDLCPWLLLRCLLLIVRFLEIVKAMECLDLCLEICAYFFRLRISSLHALDYLVLCAHEVGQLFHISVPFLPSPALVLCSALSGFGTLSRPLVLFLEVLIHFAEICKALLVRAQLSRQCLSRLVPANSTQVYIRVGHHTHSIHFHSILLIIWLDLQKATSQCWDNYYNLAHVDAEWRFCSWQLWFQLGSNSSLASTMHL